MSFNFNSLRVLVVEDTDPMMKLVVSVFETLGIGTIYTAENVEDGFHLFCLHKPDIVITDWHMVPLDGLDLIRKIRRHKDSPKKMVPIVLMTGYSALARVSEARDAGVTEFLVKPFSATDLSRRIAYVINKPRDFIDCEGFFGPDRRRGVKLGYKGQLRRDTDPKSQNQVQIG